MAVFTRDFTDEDLDIAKSGLAELGFNRLRQLRSRPPKLTATLAGDESRERLDEVMAFLRTVPHCEVRLSHPKRYGSP